jgi:hypothetical protein
VDNTAVADFTAIAGLRAVAVVMDSLAEPIVDFPAAAVLVVSRAVAADHTVVAGPTAVEAGASESIQD